MNLGKLSVTNSFIYDGQDGTLSHKYKKHVPSRSDDVSPSAASSNSTFDRDNVMNRSVYGSLEEDFRGPASHEHCDDGARLPTAILSSFYSALGVSTTASVSTCIVQPNGSAPCVSAPRMGAGTYQSPSPASAHSSTVNCSWNDSDDYRCLLDVMHIELCDTQVYSACWKPSLLDVSDADAHCLVFQSFVIQREVSEYLRTFHASRCRVSFYPRDAMQARVTAIAMCPSVCPSVCLSVTRRYCVKTKKASGMISSPSRGPKTLVF